MEGLCNVFSQVVSVEHIPVCRNSAMVCGQIDQSLVECKQLEQTKIRPPKGDV